MTTEAMEVRLLLTATSDNTSIQPIDASPESIDLPSSDDWTVSSADFDSAFSDFAFDTPDVSLSDLTGSAAAEGTDIQSVVAPYTAQIEEAAAGFTQTTTDAWQGTQQQTAEAQTASMPPEDGDAPIDEEHSVETDSWLAAFLGTDHEADAQTSNLNPDATQQPSVDPEGDGSQLADDAEDLPEPTVGGGFTTTTTVNGDTTTTTWYLSASITFSFTISTTTMADGTAAGGESAPSASFNLSLDAGSFSSDESDINFQESSSSNSGSGSKSVQVTENNTRTSTSSFALNLGSSSSSATASQSSTTASSSGAASPGASPVTFSSTSHNSHQKTTLYATASDQQSEWSDSSSSTQADIEESSSGSTSIEFSLAGFSYETTSKSQSQFSYIAESQSASDPPTSSDGTPGSASESRSLHVIETLDESESKFGFGFGSNGLEYTNEYSSNETVSDLSEHEGEWETWTLVYPELDSSTMDADNAPPPPVWVQGPNLTDGSNTTIQYNYGGDQENGFEGQFTETYHYWMDYLNDDGTVGTYQDTVPTIVTFPNTNDSDNADGSGNPGGPDDDHAGTQPPDGSDPPTTKGADDDSSQMAAYSDGIAADGSTSSQLGNGGVPTGGTVVTQPNGEQWVYDADGNLFGMIHENGNVVWPVEWPPGGPSESPTEPGEDPDSGFGADDAASIGIGFIPIVGSGQSVVELIFGHDYITGEPTSRWLAAAGIVAGMLPGGKGALKAGAKAANLAKAAEAASTATVRVTGSALAGMRKAFAKAKPQAWKEEAAANAWKYTSAQLDRMKKGLAPLGTDGFPMEIHHRIPLAEGGSNAFSNFEFLTRTLHRLGPNYKINHPNLP